MPQQTDHATPTRVEKVDRDAEGRKLRVAGRILSYEPITGLALLVDGEQGVIVDVSLCIDGHSSSWTRERMCLAMVVGHIETMADAVAIPTIPGYAPALWVDGRLILRAVMVTGCEELDLEAWKEAIAEGGEG